MTNEGDASDFETELSALIEKYIEIGPEIRIKEMVGTLECEKARFIARWLSNPPQL